MLLAAFIPLTHTQTSIETPVLKKGKLLSKKKLPLNQGQEAVLLQSVNK